MGFLSRVLLIAIIVILILVFIPKHYGSVICFGCQDRTCKCLGYEQDKTANPYCIGIPYDCTPIQTSDETTTQGTS